MVSQSCESIVAKRNFLHLAYLDDSDTKSKTLKWQVMSAVIIEDKIFKFAEIAVSAQAESLMGAEKLAKFQEFHACELYGGYGPFEGIDQDKRFDTIQKLLVLLEILEIWVIFGAVDLDELRTAEYGSADPVDVCFRRCIAGIRSCAGAIAQSRVDAELGDDIASFDDDKTIDIIGKHEIEKLMIVIVDECDAKIKSTLQKSFRSLRPQRIKQDTALDCLHDDMYFGDSRYSIGIQLADLCSYFIARHLEGDKQTENFYQMIEPRIFPIREAGRHYDATRDIRQSNDEDSDNIESRIAAQNGRGEES